LTPVWYTKQWAQKTKTIKKTEYIALVHTVVVYLDEDVEWINIYAYFALLVNWIKNLVNSIY
jgi:hypothetical protein